MFLEICMQIYSVVFALSRQTNKQKTLRKQLISFAQVITFCKISCSSGGGLTPTTPCVRPWWCSTKTQIMTLFYLGSRDALVDIFNWTNNGTCFWKFWGGIARLLYPWLRDQLARLASFTYNSGSQTFMSLGPLQKTLNTCGPCSSIKIPSVGVCSVSARGPQRTVPWPPRGTRAPFEKLWLRNKSCKRLGSRPKRSIKPCCTNRTIK